MNRLWQGMIWFSASWVLAACGGSGSTSDDNPDPEAQGLLKPVSSPAELEQSIKSGFSTILESTQFTDALAAESGAGFTGTYTQEARVDELDAVRYDGSHLYIAPRRFFNCCFIATDVPGTSPEPERSIRILQTDPASDSASLASTIPLADDISIQGMYVADDRLFALTGTSLFGSFGGLWADVAIWAPESLGFQIYDVADPANPELQIEAIIDGVFVDSRRIGNTVYIVSRYAPAIEGLEYAVTTTAQQASNLAILDTMTLNDLLPSITVNEVSNPLVDPDQCYITNEDGVDGYPVITSITAIPLDDPAAFSTTCYNQDAYGAYVSENAIYFTEFRTDESFFELDTRIHKFALSGASVSYRGSADIDGQVWRGGQADFRMSEHAGDLRVFATEFDWSSDDFFDHSLYVMRESATKPVLEIMSQLPNADRPQEIGKPNEALYGVRFLDDRTYAVTFEQIDPLYVIDLLDPLDPFIAGELQVTGFSDFLHPVNDNLLLGLGTGGAGGIKLELFDVSNISQPLSRGSNTLGGWGSYSEARYDRHAFTYQQDVNGVDRFTIPAEIYAVDGSYEFMESGLFLFEVRDKNQPGLASLSSVGSIVPPPDNVTIPYVDRSRAFINDDSVFYIRDETVWSANWFAPTTVNGPF